MRITRWGAVAAGALAGALALAGPAAAADNEVLVTVGEPGECGETTISTAWATDQHIVANTVLVVLVDGQVLTAPVGESITVGPFEADTLIQWRVWGGGERDYDNPSLPDLEVLLAYLEHYPGGELDATAPVAWHELTVYGCPPATPTPDRTPDATTSPTPEPTEEPTVGPDDETPAPGQGGGDQLPLTGASVPLLVGGALALALVGAGLWLLVRRRRVTFSA